MLRRVVIVRRIHLPVERNTFMVENFSIERPKNTQNKGTDQHLWGEALGFWGEWKHTMNGKQKISTPARTYVRAGVGVGIPARGE
jgi:hypothetical protein